MDGKKIARRVSGQAYSDSSDIDLRRFGSKGPMLPMLGLGGQVTFQHGTEAEAENLFETVVDAGVRYIDTAHDYGASQERLGRYMAAYPDHEFFVATKTAKRDRDDFMRELDENIELLGRTPDVLHVHSVNKGEQQEILRSGGALESAHIARDRGLCRFVGLTSHDDPDSVWEVARWGGGVDVTMVALNAADTRFLDRYIPWCRSKGIAVVAMKVMGRGTLVRPDGPGVRSGSEALTFALSCPVDMAVVGFSFPEEVQELTDSVRGFDPMTAAEMRDLVDGTALYADDVWFYRGEMDWDKAVDRRPSLDWQLPSPMSKLGSAMSSRDRLDDVMRDYKGLAWVTRGAAPSEMAKAFRKLLSKADAESLIDDLERDDELHPDVIDFLRMKQSKR